MIAANVPSEVEEASGCSLAKALAELANRGRWRCRRGGCVVCWTGNRE